MANTTVKKAAAVLIPLALILIGIAIVLVPKLGQQDTHSETLSSTSEDTIPDVSSSQSASLKDGAASTEQDPILEKISHNLASLLNLPEDAINLTQADLTAMIQWYEALGMVPDVEDPTDASSYANYELSQLETLLEQGDLRAFDVLRRQHQDEMNTEEMDAFAKKGAMLGSLHATMLVSHGQEHRAQSAYNVGDEASYKEHYIENLAYSELAKARTGRPVASTDKSYKMKSASSAAELQTAVQKRRTEILNNINQERASMGLAPLNTEAPEIIRLLIAARYCGGDTACIQKHLPARYHQYQSGGS